jgi:hypothetical protein
MSQDFCQIFLIYTKNHRLGYGFKNLQKIYRLAYGFLFFVILISVVGSVGCLMTHSAGSVITQIEHLNM